MTTTATTSQEHFTQAARTGQEAMSTTIRTWGETMQNALGTGRGGDGPDPVRLVDAWFDIAGQALAAQRELTKAVFDAGTPMIDALSRAATRMIETAEKPTQETTQATTPEAAQETNRPSRTGAARRTAERAAPDFVS
jgi:hypothetical protein